MLVPKINKKLLLVLAGVGLLCSCAVHPPRNSDVEATMNSTLQRAIYNNQTIAHAAKPSLPSVVNQALSPQFGLNVPTDTTPMAKRFDITVKDMPARDFFMGLVKDSNLSMMVDPEVKGDVSLSLKSVTLPEVLAAVQNVYGYQYAKTAYGYQISPRHMETRMFTVNYLDVDRTGTSDTTVSSGEISSKVSGESSTTTTQTVKPSSSVATQSNNNFWSSLQTALAAIVGGEKDTKMVINADAGIILVHAYPKTLDEVAKYLDSLQNVIEREVILEAEVLEVDLNANFQSGIDWQALGLRQASGLIPTSGTVSDFNVRRESSNSEEPPGYFSVYTHPGQDFKGILELINTQGRVNVLSSPRISTLNNQKAVIKVGTDQFYITNVDTETTSGTTAATTSQDVELTPFFSGIALDVTPQIAQDGDIILHIHPLISTVEQHDLTYTIATGGSTGTPQTLPLARSTIRESDNIVRAKNGQVIVIGGLMENRRQDQNDGTPGADKLPGVGALFKRSNLTSEKTELVILLKPTVVGGGTWTNQLQQTARSFNSLPKDFSYSAKLDKRN